MILLQAWVHQATKGNDSTVIKITFTLSYCEILSLDTTYVVSHLQWRYVDLRIQATLQLHGKQWSSRNTRNMTTKCRSSQLSLCGRPHTRANSAWKPTCKRYKSLKVRGDTKVFMFYNPRKTVSKAFIVLTCYSTLLNDYLFGSSRS